MKLQTSLENITVLELGSAIAGPSAARHLADMGATVIKVEPPLGDQLRTWGTLAPDGSSWWFKSHNRNKQLLVFDIRREDDAAIVRELGLKVDIIIENFRPGWLQKYGLDADSMRNEKPELIYVSISGYGQDGPLAERPGYGSIAESLGGFRHITGEADGPPMRMGLSIADELAGLNAALAAVAALRAREIDGVGETIDVSLIESTFSLLESILPEFVHAGKVAGRVGNRLASIAPSNIYPTADNKWIVIAGNGEGIFRRLSAAMGNPALADDPRFATNQERVANIGILDEKITLWTKQHSLDRLDMILADAGVPAGSILAIDDIVVHPQFVARSAIRMMKGDDGNDVATYGPAAHCVERPIKIERPAGKIGRDQDAVLKAFGIGTTEA